MMSPTKRQSLITEGNAGTTGKTSSATDFILLIINESLV